MNRRLLNVEYYMNIYLTGFQSQQKFPCVGYLLTPRQNKPKLFFFLFYTTVLQIQNYPQKQGFKVFKIQLEVFNYIRKFHELKLNRCIAQIKLN